MAISVLSSMMITTTRNAPMRSWPGFGALDCLKQLQTPASSRVIRSKNRLELAIELSSVSRCAIVPKEYVNRARKRSSNARVDDGPYKHIFHHAAEQVDEGAGETRELQHSHRLDELQEDGVAQNRLAVKQPHFGNTCFLP
eukprot:2166295-Prymnesium_polylepis.1